MLKIILPLALMLLSCGKKVEEVPAIEESRSPDSVEIEAEFGLKTGIDSDGHFYFGDYFNNLGDNLCLDIPNKINNIQGDHYIQDKIILEINKLPNGMIDVYCEYRFRDDVYTISNCYDQLDRPLGVMRFWFSELDTSILLRMDANSNINQKSAELNLTLDECGD